MKKTNVCTNRFELGNEKAIFLAINTYRPVTSQDAVLKYNNYFIIIDRIYVSIQRDARQIENPRSLFHFVLNCLSK